jgi:type I restriction enzyme M protein
LSVRSTKSISEDIRDVEGFDVRFIGVSGEHVSLRRAEDYPYERAARNAWTVSRWKRERFEVAYPDYRVEVLDLDGTPVHGKTLLGNLRLRYVETSDGESHVSSGLHADVADRVKEEVVRLRQDEGSAFEVSSPSRRPPAGTSAAVTSGPAAPGHADQARMRMTETERLRALEDRLWRAADTLRAGSSLAASEYSVPVLGLIFLRYADVRFTQVERELGPSTGRRLIGKADYQARGVMFVPDEARFGYLQRLPEGADRGTALNRAMELIEQENPDLVGVLPRDYARIDNRVLAELLRLIGTIPDDIEGDAIGKIYEYFLGNFAMSEGQRGGEFFTPTSIVKLIVDIIEPFHGRILDPACGSGGMFVQSARFVEQHQGNTNEISIFGQERVEATIRLAKMNLAVHGLSGSIVPSNSYYEDPHNSFGRFDFVIANPPFNVNAIDKDRLKDDKRYPYGIPSVDNGNYLWIQIFSSAINDTGRAGFVMANSASDARHSELAIRRGLIEDRQVDVVVAIGPSFFYTVGIPVTLWFMDRGKLETDRADEVLFIDARHIFRQIDRAHRDFTPDQHEFVANIVRLYRGDEPEYLNGSEGMLKDKFPDLTYLDITGLCKVATVDEIASHDWSLNPGRYVGVVAGSDDDFDFANRFGELTADFEALTMEAQSLSARIIESASDLASHG